jgi:S-adenosylmethionine:tRNA ribosyltransferase-isomerase
VKTSLFSFDLPEELIAQEPLADRESSRLLVLDRSTGGTSDSFVRELPRWIEPGSLVVLNDSRVRKARLFGQSESGGRVEALLLRRREPDLWEIMAGRSRRLKRGKRLRFPDGVEGEITGGENDIRLIRFSPPIDDAYLGRHGHVPLPPYIRRADTEQDAERYQTVFARTIGSAAAPTAGLHFTAGLLSRLEAAGITIASVTLHVGLGTFLPIRSEAIEDHIMHEESFSISRRTKELVEGAIAGKRPVVAVGTTVVRALESAWRDGSLREGQAVTRIFIYPGYRFQVVSALFTNFHTPGSSLLALVCAFAGRNRILSAYREAVEKRYRFFSYGDAMLIR